MGILPRIHVCVYACTLLLLHHARYYSSHIINVILISLYNNTISQVPLLPFHSKDSKTEAQGNWAASEGNIARKPQSQDPNVNVAPALVFLTTALCCPHVVPLPIVKLVLSKLGQL